MKVCESRVETEWSFQDSALIVQCSFSAHLPGLHIPGAFPWICSVFGGCSKTPLAQATAGHPVLLNGLTFLRSILEHPFWCMIPAPLCKLLVAAVCSSGVSEELFTHWRISWGAQASPSSTPPSLPNPSTDLCLHLPVSWASPWTEPGVGLVMGVTGSCSVSKGGV